MLRSSKTKPQGGTQGAPAVYAIIISNDDKGMYGL